MTRPQGKAIFELITCLVIVTIAHWFPGEVAAWLLYSIWIKLRDAGLD